MDERNYIAFCSKFNPSIPELTKAENKGIEKLPWCFGWNLADWGPILPCLINSLKKGGSLKVKCHTWFPIDWKDNRATVKCQWKELALSKGFLGRSPDDWRNYTSAEGLLFLSKLLWTFIAALRYISYVMSILKRTAVPFFEGFSPHNANFFSYTADGFSFYTTVFH